MRLHSLIWECSTGLVLIFDGDLRTGDHALLGGVLVVLAALCYAIGALLIHKKLQFVQPLGIAAIAMMVSTVALLLPGALSWPHHAPPLKATLALIALGIVFTGFTLTLFYGLISRVGPARARRFQRVSASREVKSCDEWSGYCEAVR
jgi:drug/metabolite transporter (DMT)-like permease